MDKSCRPLSVFLSVWLFVLATGVWAQTTSTEILGLVRDSSGAVIPGADVEITRVATGEVRRGVTNSHGQYSFPLIEPGIYQIRVEMPGFRPHVASGVEVQFQQRARINVDLQVGELDDEVEVVANARRVLNTEDAAVSLNIEAKRIVELPVVARNIGHLAIMVPGVTFGGRMGARTGMDGQSPPGTAVALVAHGQHELNQTITLDGVDAKEPRIHTMSLTPSLDAIEEFKVQTAAYSAEYGLGGGAHVQVSMKSGTNQFHGSLYDFVRNDAMDAEHYFLNFELAPGEQRRRKQALRRNQFGAFLSGPVILPGYDGRNRTFWSFNYEGRRELSEDVQETWYPSDAMRRGDFSEILLPVDAQGKVLRNRTGGILRGPVVIFDPLTGEPFPNNVIPANRIHPGARNVIDNFVPRQQFRQADPLDFTNRGVVAPTINQDAWFFRIDHNITDNDRVFVRLAWDHQKWDRPTLNPNNGLFYFNKPLNLASQWVHSFNSAILNEFRFGFQHSKDDTQHRRVTENFNQDSLGLGPFRVVGDGNRPLEGRENGIPPIGLFGLGDGGEGAGVNNMTTFNVANHVSVLRGDHSFKVGFEYRQPRVHRLAANLTRGQLSFGELQGGHSVASFMMGYPNVATTAEGLPLTVTHQQLWSAYFLDNWKISPKFTANLGIRYDYIGVPLDSEGLWRTIDYQRTFTTPDGRRIPTVFPTALGDAGAVPLWENDNRFFMPRLGLAYRPLDKWVIRTGIGWYANVVHANNYTILNLMPPRSGTLDFTNIMDVAKTLTIPVEGQNFTVRTRKFRPGTDIVQMGNQLFEGPSVVRPENLLHIQPDRRNNSHWTWTFDVQRELPFNTALTVGYVGSKSNHVPNSIGNWNQAPPSPDTNVQRRRPVQHFHDPLRPEVPVRDLGNVRFLDSGATAWYNGLVVSLDKRYSSGIAYGLSYTYSKAVGEGQGGGNEGVSFQNPLDRAGSKGPQQFDRRHVGVVNFIYELPFMRSAGGVGQAILGGWQANGILAFRSGFSYTVAGSNPLNTGGPTRPDRIGDGRLDNPTRQRWFDTKAFQRVTCNIPSRPDLCHFGSSGIGILNGPGESKLDLSMYKNFMIPGGPEDLRLQLRVEAFNAFNTPYFGDPTNIGFSTADTIIPDSLRGGEIRSLSAPMRIMQVALKIMW